LKRLEAGEISESLAVMTLSKDNEIWEWIDS
jgi:hypothetical protein